jgi:SAM-dependent methyltransferase
MENGMSNADYDSHDQAFLEEKKKNPKLTFAQYYTVGVAEMVKGGASHPTLGAKLNKYPEWWEAGEKAFANLLRLFPIEPSSRVADYGCGSLRIGGHFIKHLDPGCYFGLDVISGFYEIGKGLVGEKLVKEKKPRFAVLSDKSVARAAKFAPDFVYSSAVSYHVHPDEAAAYYANLSKIAHKSGAVLFFDATVSDNHFRYRHRSWSWPMDFYLKSLGDMKFVRYIKSTEREEDGQKFSVGFMEFARP